MLCKKLVVIMLVLNLFSFKAYGSEVYHWFYDENNNIQYKTAEIIFTENISAEEKALFLFDNFFTICNNEEVNFIPEGTELIDVKLKDGNLNLYMSSEIKSYGGGSEWEINLVGAILCTAFSLKEVKNVTLYIGGQIDYLPEGIMLDKYRREDFSWNK